MRLLPMILVVLAIVAGAAPSVSAQPQMPGDSPRLTVSDGFDQAPGLGDPFDSTGVLTTQGGVGLNLSVSYLAEDLIHENVAWGLLLSSQVTPFPLDQLPPPLFTLPPFRVIIPPGGMLDVEGTGSLIVPIPAGFVDGTAYLQAIVQDPGTPGGTVLRLSNGVRVDIGPPDYSVAFSFALALPELIDDEPIETTDTLQGVASRDIDPLTLNTFPPFGFTPPPGPELNDVFPTDFRFLPIVPTGVDGPIRPLESRPSTVTTEGITATDEVELLVDDTTGFPPSGELYINFNGSNLAANRANNNERGPDVEVVRYSGKTPDSFTGLSRKQLGSEGGDAYPHPPGAIVLGQYSNITTANVLRRDSVGLDARNPDMPKVTLPRYTFEMPDPGGGEGGGGEPEIVTRELDILRYDVPATGASGFALLDHLTHEFELIPGTEFLAGDSLEWDPVITVTPDARAFLATLRVGTGVAPNFASDPDRIFAIRTDGLDWPASGAPVWEITYEVVEPEPAVDDEHVRSRRVIPESCVVVNSDPEDFVAYIGLAHKFAQSNLGKSIAEVGTEDVGYEHVYIREEILVRDLIEIPLVPPGSNKGVPASERPWIVDDFPTLGTGDFVLRFDPYPLLSPNGDMIALAAGRAFNREDMYVIRNVSIDPDGSVSRFIFNISGHGLATGSGEGFGSVRPLTPVRGAGTGRRVAFSPDGTRVAWASLQNNVKDFLNVARTNGLDFGDVIDQYKVTTQVDGSSVLTFLEGGPFDDASAVMQLHWSTNDEVVFCMGEYDISDSLYQDDPSGLPRLDIFAFDVNTEIMTNVSRTHSAVEDFGAFGSIRSLTSWKSTDERYIFYLRDGAISAGNTILPVGTRVTNLIAYDTISGQMVDVTGDEFSDSASLPNIRISQAGFLSMVEVPAGYDFVNGSGVQADSIWFDSVEVLDDSDAEQVFTFRESAPVLAFQATNTLIDASRTTNLTPSPYSGKVAFARTNAPNPNGNSQHPYIVDIDSFLFERDLAPSVVSGGNPIGRVMDGSFHFIEPTVEAGEGFVFSFGLSTLEPGIVAARTGVFYLSLDNVSDTFLEPEPRVISVVDTIPLGTSSFPQVYVPSAGPSAMATLLDP